MQNITVIEYKILELKTRNIFDNNIIMHGYNSIITINKEESLHKAEIKLDERGFCNIAKGP